MSNDRLRVILGHLRKPQLPLQLSRSTSAASTPFTHHQDSGLYEYTSTGTLDHHVTGTNILTNEQRQFYEDNGFLVIQSLVPHELIDRWRMRFLDLIENQTDYPALTIMKDISLKNKPGISAERIVNKIQDFVWDEILSEHCQLPQVLDYVECFTGPNIMAMHTMLINKPPDSGTQTSRHPMHQDLHYFPFRPANRIVCAWTAMEKIDTNNGCLFVVPGSHKGTLQEHNYPEWENGVNKMYHGVRGFDHLPKVSLEMEKGDTVFFHPLLFHGSGANKTQHFRKAISCHYAAAECHFIDVKGTTQENIAKEVEEIARRKWAPDGMDFRDLWKFRSRCVRGVESP